MSAIRTRRGVLPSLLLHTNQTQYCVHVAAILDWLCKAVALLVCCVAFSTNNGCCFVLVGRLVSQAFQSRFGLRISRNQQKCPCSSWDLLPLLVLFPRFVSDKLTTNAADAVVVVVFLVVVPVVVGSRIVFETAMVYRYHHHKFLLHPNHRRIGLNV